MQRKTRMERDIVSTVIRRGKCGTNSILQIPRKKATLLVHQFREVPRQGFFAPHFRAVRLRPNRLQAMGHGWHRRSGGGEALFFTHGDEGRAQVEWFGLDSSQSR